MSVTEESGGRLNAFAKEYEALTEEGLRLKKAIRINNASRDTNISLR